MFEYIWKSHINYLNLGSSKLLGRISKLNYSAYKIEVDCSDIKCMNGDRWYQDMDQDILSSGFRSIALFYVTLALFLKRVRQSRRSLFVIFRHTS